jgi:hypothetical protein
MLEISEKLKNHICDILGKNTKTSEALVSDFNKILFWVIDLTSKKYPANNDLPRVRKLMSLGKSYNQNILIEEVGPYLFQYGDKILERSIHVFNDELKQNISNEIQQKRTNENESNVELASSLFSLAQKMVDTLSKDEQVVISQKLVELLDDYLLFTNL